MQIRKYPARCSALPHTKQPFVQVVCQKPPKKREVGKVMGILCNLEPSQPLEGGRLPAAQESLGQRSWQSLVLRQQLCRTPSQSRGRDVGGVWHRSWAWPHFSQWTLCDRIMVWCLWLKSALLCNRRSDADGNLNYIILC